MDCKNCPVCTPQENLNLKLPFSEDMQDAVLGHLLTNPQFFLNSRNKITPNWFINTHCGKVYTAQLRFFEKFHRMPSLEELKSEREILTEEQKTKNLMYARITLAVGRTTIYGLDRIRADLTDWYKSVLFQHGIEKSVKLFNAKKVGEGCDHISKIGKQLREAVFDDGEVIKFDNPKQIYEEIKTDYKNALTSGLTLLDKVMLPEGVDAPGGLFPGDTTIVLAPLNIGKSSVLITTLVHNIKQGKKCLYMSHEGRTNDLRNKIYQSMLNCSPSELLRLYETPDGFAEIEKASKVLNQYLTYIPYNKPGMVVEDVEPIIRRHQETLMSSSPDGKGFDLVVSDYPGKLSTRRALQGNLQQRTVDLIVYDYYVQMALEYKFHSLLAIQSNREGAKVNQGKEDRFLEYTDVHESIGPMQIATNIITLNRDLDAQLNDYMTLYVCKSRSSRVGAAVTVKTNFRNCVTHSNNLGGYCYYANAPMSDKVNKFLEMYNGTIVPDAELHLSRSV